jgi:hypothetical protein
VNLRELLLAEAGRYIGTREEPKGSNAGVRISGWLDLVGMKPGAPWCAAFIWAMGLQATGRSLWPVKASALVQAIVDHATAEGRFTKDATQARPGDLVVFFYPGLGRYGHIGIVEEVKGGRVISVDGNTAPDAKPGTAADREGYGVFTKNRALSDRVAFIRWAA